MSSSLLENAPHDLLYPKLAFHRSPVFTKWTRGLRPLIHLQPSPSGPSSPPPGISSHFTFCSKTVGTNPSVFSVYKMEVLRDTCTKTQPVFRVTTDDGYQFDGPDPSSCWNKIYEKIRKIHSSSYDESQGEGESMSVFKSGADMFDFSDPHVLKLIQGTSNSKMISGSLLSMPIGYSHVHVKWKDLDKCNVCHMDEVETKLRLPAVISKIFQPSIHRGIT
ncbi:unnamed protein product [Lactuca saligna]|uniref:FYR C-terminal domain-containing protein n=1 Tax=Lactuca saligna TaxID=75948 RepID=A0AA35ZQ32_LACSI|nr:unnamed protein product [Lactuca saligna]